MQLQELTHTSVALIIANIQNAAGPLAGVIFLLILTCLADVATGLFAAWKSNSLDLKYVDSFITSHVQNKWLPILGTLFGGVALGGVDNVLGGALVAAAIAQIGLYETQVFGSSVTTNLNDASAKTKGIPGSVSLSPATMIEGFIESTVGQALQVLTFHPNGQIASISIGQPAAGDVPTSLDPETSDIGSGSTDAAPDIHNTATSLDQTPEPAPPVG